MTIERIDRDRGQGNPFSDALEYLREHGWCQRKLRNERGQVCIEGALLADLVAESVPVHRLMTAYRALQRACQIEYPDSVMPLAGANPWDPRRVRSVVVSDYNDRVFTSQQDAERVLQRASRIWEESQE